MNMSEQMGNMDIRRRVLEGVFEAEKMRMSAEHYIKVIMPLSNENKILVRALERIYSGIVLIINRVLHFEHFIGRVKLSQDKEENLKVFLKVAKGYGLNDSDLSLIKEILVLGRKHKESGMEFSRIRGFVILDDNLKHYKIDENKLDEFLKVERRLFDVVKNALKGSFKEL